MTVVFHSKFSTDRDGFDVGTHVAAEGADQASGYLSVGAGETTVQLFTAVSSGVLRAEWKFRINDATVGTSHGFVFGVYPSVVAIGSANSAAYLGISRAAADSATSTVVRATYRNSAGFQAVTPLLSRYAWHTAAVEINIAARTYSLTIDGVSVATGQASANASYTDINRFAAVAQASLGGHLDNVLVESSYTAPSLATTDYDDVSFAYSPGNWFDTGTYQETNYPGAFVRVLVDVPASGEVYADFNTAHHSALDNTLAQGISWTIDGVRSGTFPLRYSASTVRVLLARGLSAGIHEFKIHYLRRGTSSTSSATLERWTGTLTGTIRFLGIAATTGSTVSAPTIPAKSIIWFGDSMAEGAAAVAGGILQSNDPTYGAHYLLSEDIDTDLGVVGLAAQGWTTLPTNAATAADLEDAWDFIKSGTARDISGLDFVVINEGTNDLIAAASDASVEAAVEVVLAAQRAANATAWIFLVIPYAGDKATAITDGFDDYQVSTPDARCKLINLGSAVSSVIENGTYSHDGLHPNIAGQALVHTNLLPVVRGLVNAVHALSFTAGSLKTDAAGDTNTDGYNETNYRHEINCSAGAAAFTLQLTSPDYAYWPKFRLHSHTQGSSPVVTIEGVTGVADTDYTWTDNEDGTGDLQLLSNRTADTDIAVGEAVPAAGIKRLINGGLTRSRFINGGLVRA